MSQSKCHVLLVVLSVCTVSTALAQVIQPGPNPTQTSVATEPYIQSATYASPRNGRSFDVTNQLKSLCHANSGSCLLTCGNQLAGDPDFGIVKYCKVIYVCPGGQAQLAQIPEGGLLTLTCPPDAATPFPEREAILAPSYAPSSLTSRLAKASGVDCGRARGGPEQAICEDPELMRLDGDLAAAYAQAFARSGIQRQALIEGERRWISERNKECGAAPLPSWISEQCMSQAYEARLAQLREWAAPQYAPRSPANGPRMNVGDQVNCDEIISSAGITLTSGQGWGIPLSTPCSFRPPVDITIVARADPTNLRIRYAAEQVIFNWEGDRTQLRIDGGPASGLNQPGAGAIPIGQYVTIRWLVTPSSQDIYVNGQLRFHHNGDYSHIDRPVSVFTAEGSSISVKSIIVRKVH